MNGHAIGERCLCILGAKINDTVTIESEAFIWRSGGYVVLGEKCKMDGHPKCNGQLNQVINNPDKASSDKLVYPTAFMVPIEKAPDPVREKEKETI